MNSRYARSRRTRGPFGIGGADRSYQIVVKILVVERVRRRVNRRTVLATVAGALLAGCLADDDTVPTSEGTEDVPIERSPGDLPLSLDDLPSGAWEERRDDRDHCREFSRDAGNERLVLTSCAWVYEDAATAREEYELLVGKSQMETGVLQDEEPTVGVEAGVVDGGYVIDVIFRDANAVGRVEYGLEPDGGLDQDEFPDPEDAIAYAARMHRRWRD